MMEAVSGGPCLEVDPSRFVIVLGASFTANVLQQALGEDVAASLSSPRSLPAMDAKAMVDRGICVLLESGQFQSETERAECERRYRSALEAEPLAKLVPSMHQCGRYVEWLERCFRLNATSATCPPILTQLARLQENGSLLVYTGCDDVLSKLMNQQVIIAEEKECVVQWGTGERRGILHAHGVYWKPESVQLDCAVYKDPTHPTRSALEHFGAVLKDKFVVSLGVCDTEQLLDNPMMAVFTRTFLTAADQGHSFNLPMTPLPHPDDQELRSGLLHLPCVRSPWGNRALPDFTVTPLSESTRTLCNEIDFPSEQLVDHQMMALLVASKAGASEIAKMVFSCPGVKFALMSPVGVSGEPACTVSMRVESAKLPELWVWLWEENKTSLIGRGLVAMVMQSGTVIWIQGTSRGCPSPGTDYRMETAQRQFKQEQIDPPLPMESSLSSPVVKPNPKLLPPLVRQEFPIPKPGVKKIPRYTVTKFPMKPTPGTSFTLPPGNCLSKSHHLHSFNDDSMLHSQQMSDFPKSVLARRSSLPPTVNTGSGSDSMLYKLAENCQQGPSSELHPPSYTAIKQALLCDKYKRRQSMQTDPKTLKNLLQTKLVISDKSEDLVNLRRKSDPGSYMKQRDFDRRKELFLDENLLWSKSYGKVIDQNIQKWHRKRQQKMQRDMLSWQQAEALNPLKLGMINPLMATQQGIINPLQVSGGLGNPSLFPGTFLNTGTTGGVVNPYALGQGVLAGSTGATAYYSPFGQYALVSPYPSLQLPAAQKPPQSSTTYLVPQATLGNAPQPNIYYYVPAPPTSSVTAAATTVPSLGTSSVSMTTMAMSSDQHGTMPVPSPPGAGGGVSLYAQSPSPPSQTPRPVSPNSRKRHQSVPEKLTMLLQPPPLLCNASGRISPMEMNPDSPPSSKKQRSTSDTTLYHTPYGFSQHSPSSGSHHRHSTSPQPPPQVSYEGLSSLQTHLLQVHQSYGLNKTAQEGRQMRRHRSPKSAAVQGHSPRRKHSGGVVKSGSVSPASVQSNDGEEGEQWEGSPWGMTGGERRGSGGEVRRGSAGEIRSSSSEGGMGEMANNDIKMEMNGSPQDNNNNSSQLPLWQFLLELLVSSDTNFLRWTDNEFEFEMTKPTEVSRLWGQFTNNNTMCYDKVLAGLRGYFKQGIMSQVQGRKLTFKFAGHIRNYVQMRRSQVSATHEEVVVV